jgi:RNA polymerase sigma-70 factor (ECF subfamily)
MKAASLPVETVNIKSFYQNNHAWLLQLFNQKLGNHADAADLAHDVFLRLIKKPKMFDHNSGARAYLSHMAKGMCIDLWRRKQIEQAFHQALAERGQVFEQSAEYQHSIIQALVQVDTMLSKLPEKVSRAFWLSQLEGKRYHEIAVELKVSERMVKKYMAQAMFKMAILAARNTE